MQKRIAFLTIVAAMMAGFMTYAIGAPSYTDLIPTPPVTRPHVDAVWYEFDSDEPTTTTPITIVVPMAITQNAKQWSCSAPRGLATSTFQTVKECEWR